MVDSSTFARIALSLSGAVEEPHFEKRSFRIKKKIFATLHAQKNSAVLKLSLVDQSVFCSMDPKAFCPVQGSWGKQGWTMVDLNLADEGMLTDAIAAAYSTVLGKR
ncbi:MAG: MmcQ/YjbR family DNA-binding protein [Saprospiraceae bacterium]